MSSDAPLGATPARPAIANKRPELADIFALHGEAFHRDHSLPSRHLNVMRRLLLKLLDYLSRYTHRVAISNERIIACEQRQVTFAYRDRTDGDRKKTKTIPVNQFIGRFLTHVLPGRFMRVRHYGFLSNGHRKQKLATIRSLLGARTPAPKTTLSAAEWLETVLGIDPMECPCCGGRLQDDEIPRPPMRASLSFRPRNATTSGKATGSRAPPRKVEP